MLVTRYERRFCVISEIRIYYARFFAVFVNDVLLIYKLFY